MVAGNEREGAALAPTKISPGPRWAATHLDPADRLRSLPSNSSEKTSCSWRPGSSEHYDNAAPSAAAAPATKNAESAARAEAVAAPGRRSHPPAGCRWRCRRGSWCTGWRGWPRLSRRGERRALCFAPRLGCSCWGRAQRRRPSARRRQGGERRRRRRARHCLRRRRGGCVVCCRRRSIAIAPQCGPLQPNCSSPRVPTSTRKKSSWQRMLPLEWVHRGRRWRTLKL